MYSQNNSFAEGYAIGRDNSNSGGFGNDAFGNSGWWIIILLIFAWGGFGNRGGAFGSSGGVTEGYTLASDFSNIERKIDGVNNGLCDGFYAVNTSFGNLNNTLATNFASVQNTLTQGFAGLNTGMVTQGYENRLATNDLSAQVASCCCDIQNGINNVNTQSVMNTNAIQQQIAS